MFKSNIKNAAAKFGFEIRRLPVVPEQGTMTGAMRRLCNLEITPRAVIDIGAARGDWTRLFKTGFPSCDALMIEPLVENEAFLRDTCQALPGVAYELAAAGRTEGSVTFNVTPDLDGSGVYGTGDANHLVDLTARTVPQVTLNKMAKKHNLRGPFLIKFDCHGYEAPILEGADEILGDTCAIVMECYAFHVSPTAELFWQMCTRLEKLGFRPVDIVDILLRPRDKLLWQMDIVFLRSEHPAFENSGYH